MVRISQAAEGFKLHQELQSSLSKITSNFIQAVDFKHSWLQPRPTVAGRVLLSHVRNTSFLYYLVI